MSELMVIGLDGEMSSADMCTGGQLIQAGLAVWTPGGGMDTISATISWPEMEWSERAAQVHQLDRADVDAAPRADVVDAELHAWLLARGAQDEGRQVITTGFNVGAFDHPFFNAALPRLMTLIARRTIDLNAVCMTMAGWDPNPACTTPRAWTGWKRTAKREAAQRLNELGVVGREHDAGYDAALALEAWSWLRGQIHGAHTPRNR